MVVGMLLSPCAQKSLNSIEKIQPRLMVKQQTQHNDHLPLQSNKC